jgi:glucose/arabinose dehydrogenase
MHNNEELLFSLDMDKTKAIFFSAITAAVVIMGTFLSFSWLGLSSTVTPAPAKDNYTSGVAPVQDNTSASISSYNDTYTVLPDVNPPRISDANLKVEKVIDGLAFPTSMVFLDHDDMLILQKDNGEVRLVSNGALLPKPVFHTIVEKNSERGLLGVAVTKNDSGVKTVFLYYTEPDANSGEVRNRIYRFDNWTGGNLTGGKLILDLNGTPGPNHDGGKLKMGPDGMLYAVIGDLNRNGMLQNYENGPKPDDTSVLLRIDRNGNAANNTLSDNDPGVNVLLSKYYAYGIRNSFGLAFDPVTGILWDTENGPDKYDEINVVTPGFNSGWEDVIGPIDRSGKSTSNLVQFGGSHYEDPVFSWREPQGVTDIEFFNSTKLGEKYENNIFVGDINNGNLYFFKVNSERTGLALDGTGLQDLVADNADEVATVTLGTGFGGITDIETGPDGYLYILTYTGSVYRIVPADKA